MKSISKLSNWTIIATLVVDFDFTITNDQISSSLHMTTDIAKYMYFLACPTSICPSIEWFESKLVDFLSNDYVIDIVSLLTTLLHQVQLIALSIHSNWSMSIIIYLLWKWFLFCFKNWQKSAESLQFSSSISYSIWSGIKFRCYWVSLDYSKKSVPRSHSSAIICSIHIAISRPKRLYIIQ